MKTSDVRARWPDEASLCAEFSASIAAHGGWTVYPETGGFDLLCVHNDARWQLGVEAKLQLNAKVADQILPHEFGAVDHGPDFRAVLVPQVTEASCGIARLLGIVGVRVLEPDRWDPPGMGFKRKLDPREYDALAADGTRYPCQLKTWHDWNPARRCELPEFVPQVPAGVPSPIRLTTWKVGTLKVIADLELDGFVTAKSVRGRGVDPRRFCASDGFLAAIGGGKWARGTLPRYEDQHPEAYAEVLARARAEREKVVPA